MIRVYDAGGNVIETHEQADESCFQALYYNTTGTNNTATDDALPRGILWVRPLTRMPRFASQAARAEMIVVLRFRERLLVKS
jgi:hypothetical protein